MDDTPTGAMRKLTGKPTKDNRSRGTADDNIQLGRQELISEFVESTPRTSRNPVDDSLVVPGASKAPQLDPTQIQTLLELLASSTVKANVAGENQQHLLSRTLQTIELAEQNARAREARLEGMLQAVSLV
jgi:hypothetical protein